MNLRITESKSVALPLGDTPIWGERWESNPRQPEPQSGALPTELRPPYGVPLGIRTPGPRLRRALLYPAELKIHIVKHFIVLLERVPGIEPGYSAWKADILPLNYTRIYYKFNGRGDRDRTCDLMVPNHARSHLRHTPKWCTFRDSNPRPTP